jgi:acetyltransferase-like isoleucine patch superfamily enzyme
VFNKLSCRLRGIQLGTNCKFYGKTYFFKVNYSTIEIGSSCTFRSKINSNLIGINRPCMLSTLAPNARIVIGKNCGFSGTVIGSFINITLGDYVRCGSNTLITDSDWHLSDPRSGEPRPVIIGNNVWLGEGAKILKGVVIGENTVIGAGSIVTKSIPSNVIAAGNPCVVIKKLS